MPCTEKLEIELNTFANLLEGYGNMIKNTNIVASVIGSIVNYCYNSQTGCWHVFIKCHATLEEEQTYLASYPTEAEAADAVTKLRQFAKQTYISLRTSLLLA